MKIKYAKLDVEQTCGTTYMLIETNPLFNYVDGKRVGEPIAYNYTVVLPDRKYEWLRVRVDGACAIETPAEPVQVNFYGLALEVKWSQSEGNYIAGTATGIALA